MGMGVIEGWKVVDRNVFIGNERKKEVVGVDG
jgi:hypothetical protein